MPSTLFLPDGPLHILMELIPLHEDSRTSVKKDLAFVSIGSRT
jgi:hypothetical protein